MDYVSFKAVCYHKPNNVVMNQLPLSFVIADCHWKFFINKIDDRKGGLSFHVSKNCIIGTFISKPYLKTVNYVGFFVSPTFAIHHS